MTEAISRWLMEAGDNGGKTMKPILEFLSGKKTYLLVVVAVGLILGGAADTEQMAAGGLDFTEIDFNRLLQAVLASVVASAKAAFTRSTS